MHDSEGSSFAATEAHPVKSSRAVAAIAKAFITWACRYEGERE